MDKGAREKIARIIYGKQGIDLASPATCRQIATAVLLAMEQLGYRKLPKEPPLLSGEEIAEAVNRGAGYEGFDLYMPSEVDKGDRAIAQAQREVCVKHYEG